MERCGTWHTRYLRIHRHTQHIFYKLLVLCAVVWTNQTRKNKNIPIPIPFALYRSVYISGKKRNKLFSEQNRIVYFHFESWLITLLIAIKFLVVMQCELRIHFKYIKIILLQFTACNSLLHMGSISYSVNLLYCVHKCITAQLMVLVY